MCADTIHRGRTSNALFAVGIDGVNEDADTQSRIILDTLLRLGLNKHLLRGQCYDGASVMSGTSSVVVKRINDIERRVLFVHCLTHSLNHATHVVKHGEHYQVE